MFSDLDTEEVDRRLELLGGNPTDLCECPDSQKNVYRNMLESCIEDVAADIVSEEVFKSLLSGEKESLGMSGVEWTHCRFQELIFDEDPERKLLKERLVERLVEMNILYMKYENWRRCEVYPASTLILRVMEEKFPL